jgi:hypothetical protein
MDSYERADAQATGHGPCDALTRLNLNGVEIVTLGAFATGVSFTDTSTPP